MSKAMTEVLRAHWTASTHTDSKPFVDKCDGCGEVIFSWADPTVGDGYERLAAHQAAALSAAGFGLVADAKAEAKRDAAAAGVRAVCDVWGAGGRATVRLSELSEIAKDITEGEWDRHIEWNLKDIARERTRPTKAAS